MRVLIKKQSQHLLSSSLTPRWMNPVVPLRIRTANFTVLLNRALVDRDRRVTTPFSMIQGNKNFQIKSYNAVTRSFPSYSVMGEKCLLVIKPIMPKFKHVPTQSNDNAVAIAQKGRMMLEFSPKNEEKGFNWSEKISFALTAEEMGLLLSQLPHYSVTLSRRIGGAEQGGFGGSAYNLVGAASAGSNEYIDKVLTAEPGEGATIAFRIDYMKDGVGGLTAPVFAQNETSRSAPLHVVVEAGEWEVISTIFRDSIPHLLGWNQMMDISIHHAIQNREE